MTILNLQFTGIINRLIENGNLNDLKKILTFHVQNRDGFIIIGGSLVGKANDELIRNKIIELITDIPFHKDILDELQNVHQSLLNIQEKSNMIQSELNTIIQNIQRYQYKTLTTCCPTQDTSIWDSSK